MTRSLVPAPRRVWPALRLTTSWIVLLAMANIGFGALSGGWTLHGESLGLLAGLVLAWGLSPVLASIASTRYHRAVPWPPGLYLFEHGLIDGTQRSLPGRSLADLTHIGVLRRDPRAGRRLGCLELHFGDERVRVPVQGGDAAVRLGQEVRRLAGEAPSWGLPSERLRAGPPVWPSLLAVLVGLSLGLGAWAQRDRLSDDLSFESAWPSVGSGGLRLYLQNVNGRHASHIRQMLLPRAALAEASEQNSMSALMAWRAEFPGQGHDALFAPELAGLYATARTTLAQKEGHGGSLEQGRRASLGALIDWVESRGSAPLPLRFDPGGTRWLDELDRAIGGSHDGRAVVPAGTHVGAISVSRRRRHVADSIEDGIQLLLGTRLFTLVPGEGSIPDDEPGLWVRSVVRPGTSLFEVEGQGALLVELELRVEFEIAVPGAESVLLDLTLPTPDVFSAPDPAVGEQAPPTLIYEAMLHRIMEGLSLAFAEAFDGGLGER